ncbi:MAG: FAD-dependent oxidoreductase, partial [Acidobacteria bacterium]|nr:FAD-dependent oxidoreductase [Acidobacteriota bacterium]
MTFKNAAAELVVAGGGGAGLAAALAAAEHGCRNILVLEKAGSAAGSTAMAHDIFGAESPVQKREGVDASRDALFKTAMEWAHWTKINPRIVRAFIDKSGDTIGWLENKGLRFELIQYYPNQVPLVRHSVKGHGHALMKTLRENCRQLGVKIWTRTPAREILRDGKGAITGVVAAAGEGEVRIETACVVVATGGYGNNKEMLKKYCARYHDTMTYDGPPGNTGDGIRMATAVGAATAGLGTVNLHGPFIKPKSDSHWMKMDAGGPGGSPIRISLWFLAWEPETLWVNSNGRRFIDEGYNLAFFAFGNAVAMQPDGITYTLFDSSTLRKIEKEGLIRPGAASRANWLPVSAAAPLPGLEREIRKQAGKGDLEISGSWDAIAGWMGADPDVLKATVAEYNRFCDDRHDALFAKDRRYLLPLKIPPFYAVRGHLGLCDAYGGIKINEKMEALDSKDNPIPGLYAAGSTTGCWESESYCYRLTGHLVGFALNSGRIAGENAAR